MRSRSASGADGAVRVEVAEAAAGAHAPEAGRVAGAHPDQSWHAPDRAQWLRSIEMSSALRLPE